MVSAALKRLQPWMLGVGVVLLGIAAFIFALMLVGVVDLPTEVIKGESSIHSVARIAIVGCLLAAVGSQR